jgi:hypothetical protein
LKYEIDAMVSMNTNFDSCSIGDGTTFVMKKGELSAYFALIAKTVSCNTSLDITMQKCEKNLVNLSIHGL